MFGGGGGAQRGHAVADAELGQRHHVHIAFDDQNAAGFFDGGAPFMQAVEVAAFVEQRGVGRVEVFGFGVVKYAAAEADNLAARVADGKHDAVAEAVVIFAFIVDDHTAVDQRGVGVGLEHLGERLPAFGCVAQAVMFDDVGIEAALLQIVLRRRIEFELLAVEIGGRLGGFFQCLLFFLAFGALLGIVGSAFYVRHRHAGAVGQILHRFAEAQSLILHDKTDGRAVCAAAEAVVKLFAGAHRKRRRFFFVKGAAGHIICAAFFQRYVLVDDVDDIDFGQQLVYEIGWNHGGVFFQTGISGFNACLKRINSIWLLKSYSLRPCRLCRPARFSIPPSLCPYRPCRQHRFGRRHRQPLVGFRRPTSFAAGNG